MYVVWAESIGVYLRDRADFHSYVAESSMTTKDHGAISLTYNLRPNSEMYTIKPDDSPRAVLPKGVLMGACNMNLPKTKRSSL